MYVFCKWIYWGLGQSGLHKVSLSEALKVYVFCKWIYQGLGQSGLHKVSWSEALKVYVFCKWIYWGLGQSGLHKVSLSEALKVYVFLQMLRPWTVRVSTKLVEQRRTKFIISANGYINTLYNAFLLKVSSSETLKIYVSYKWIYWGLRLSVPEQI